MSQNKFNILGVYVDAIDYKAAVAEIILAARDRKPYRVSALAVHGVMTGVADARHRARLNEFDLVLPDGQPVRWAMNLLHKTKMRERVRGTTVTVKLLQAAADAGLPVYFYGSTQPTLDKMMAHLTSQVPTLQIAGGEPSRFRRLTPHEVDDVAARVQRSGARLTFVGLGCPRQERFVYAMNHQLGMPVISVGAAFDYLAGSLSSPPAVLQKHGLEWAWRLGQEPRRLWRRYLILNPAYVGLLALQASGLWDPGWKHRYTSAG